MLTDVFKCPDSGFRSKLGSDFSMRYTSDAISYDKTLIIKVDKIIFLCFAVSLELTCCKNKFRLYFLEFDKMGIDNSHSAVIIRYLLQRTMWFYFTSAKRFSTSFQLTTFHQAFI